MLRALLFHLISEYLLVCLCSVFSIGDQTQGYVHVEQILDG